MPHPKLSKEWLRPGHNSVGPGPLWLCEPADWYLLHKPGNNPILKAATTIGFFLGGGGGLHPGMGFQGTIT